MNSSTHGISESFFILPLRHRTLKETCSICVTHIQMAFKQDQRHLLIVSNRLPLSVKRLNDSFEYSPSSGGLVTSLSGLTKSTSFRWFGWPGIEVKDFKDREEVQRNLSENNAVGIFLDSSLADEHYNKFSSKCAYIHLVIGDIDSDYLDSILWPILHYQSGVIFNGSAWESYQKVNELFADSILREVSNGSLVWIHDYHLMLLPRLLRQGLSKKGIKCAIGFSLHTPFPACDFWKALPVHNELIKGMLASDLIGFHTDTYRQNFIGACVNLLYAFPCKRLAKLAMPNIKIEVFRHSPQARSSTMDIQSRQTHLLLG